MQILHGIRAAMFSELLVTSMRCGGASQRSAEESEHRGCLRRQSGSAIIAILPIRSHSQTLMIRNDRSRQGGATLARTAERKEVRAIGRSMKQARSHARVVGRKAVLRF